MRLCASRIRSINRAIARVQSSARSASGRTRGNSASSAAPVVSMNAPKFAGIIVIQRAKPHRTFNRMSRGDASSVTARPIRESDRDLSAQRMMAAGRHVCQVLCKPRNCRQI